MIFERDEHCVVCTRALIEHSLGAHDERRGFVCKRCVSLPPSNPQASAEQAAMFERERREVFGS